VLLTRGAAAAQVAVAWPEIGYPATLGAVVRDLWRHEDVGRFRGSYSATVASHGVVVVRVKP